MRRGLRVVPVCQSTSHHGDRVNEAKTNNGGIRPVLLPLDESQKFRELNGYSRMYGGYNMADHRWSGNQQRKKGHFFLGRDFFILNPFVTTIPTVGHWGSIFFSLAAWDPSLMAYPDRALGFSSFSVGPSGLSQKVYHYRRLWVGGEEWGSCQQ